MYKYSGLKLPRRNIIKKNFKLLAVIYNSIYLLSYSRILTTATICKISEEMFLFDMCTLIVIFF